MGPLSAKDRMHNKLIAMGFTENHSLYQAQMKLVTDHPDIFETRGKFEPKLDFNKRCSILACYIMDWPIPVIAEYFGVHRATVGHIVYPNRHYQKIRDTLEEMGVERFTTQFYSDRMIPALAEIKRNSDLAKLPTKAYVNEVKKVNQELAALSAKVPNPNATRHAGHHMNGEVFWLDHIPFGEFKHGGWAYRKHGDKPNDFVCFKEDIDEDTPFYTSSEAYNELNRKRLG